MADQSDDVYSMIRSLTKCSLYQPRDVLVKPAPKACSEECAIHVGGRDQAEHEKAQHNHNLLLHNDKYNTH
ncbi:unnamed protein product [Leptosia nina]|uniref:Uncharacterized protein n=1 Tax=Leptosia nina TaxID=320188 RepID=A0AAV1JAM6_9NEOP